MLTPLSGGVLFKNYHFFILLFNNQLAAAEGLHNQMCVSQALSVHLHFILRILLPRRPLPAPFLFISQTFWL